jgi:hypothetical protein
MDINRVLYRPESGLIPWNIWEYFMNFLARPQTVFNNDASTNINYVTGKSNTVGTGREAV